VSLRLIWISALSCVLACASDGNADGGDDDDSGSTADDADSTTGIDDPDPVVDWPTLECDPIAPSFCGLPFPSNVYTSADPDTETGRRVAFASAMMPTSYYDVTADPTPWLRGDGFSPGAGLMVHFEGATTTGLPRVDDIAASLADDAATVLLEAETGERVPHFAELDLSTDDVAQRVLFIRPAVRLRDATRYIVAIRRVVDASGAPLPASPAFAALRDGTPLPDEPSVDTRRPLYADIFARLDGAGVAREDLQLAWDFTTASDANNTEWLVHMRDEALAMVGDPPVYDLAVEPFGDDGTLLVTGTFEVPLFLDSPDFGAVMNLGDDGLPEPTGIHAFDFEMIIPASATTEPAKLLHFGHGLLGTQAEIESEELVALANTHGYALYSCDWIGLAGSDQADIANILQTGELEDFDGMFARLQQSVVNAMVLDRVVALGVANDPMVGAMLDPSRQHYYGISLGGIMGALFMSVSPDVERGVLEVMGMPFGILLNRSAQFDAFFQVAKATYQDGRDVQLTLALVQMLWDRVEPTGYIEHMRDDPLPDTPRHEVLMRAAVGDHSVPTVGAHIMARTLGVPLMDTGVREVWGLEASAEPPAGSAYTEYDFGLPPEPACALPQRACSDPHGNIRRLPEAAEQLDHFLRTGEVRNFCPDGVCSYPDLSGCGADDPPPDPC
jgi:hypothetical protein